jgi:hypothetical protein
MAGYAARGRMFVNYQTQAVGCEAEARPRLVVFLC